MTSMVRFSVFFLLLTCLFSYGVLQTAAAAESAAPRIAIIDLETSPNIDKSLVDLISRAMRVKLAAWEAFPELKRNGMNRVLAARTCSIISYNAECFMTTGQELGVEKLVAGKLVLHKGVYYSLLLLVDTKSGLIENISEDEFVGDREMLVTLFSESASRLVAKKFYTHEPDPKPDFLNPRDMSEFNKKVYENPGRDTWQLPETVVAKLPIKHGDTVADMGTGTGYFIPWLAKAAGNTGTVYAVDTQKEMLEYVATRVNKWGLRNVKPLRASPGDPSLPENSVNLLFLSSMYYEIRDNNAYLIRLKSTLKKGGKLVIIDFKTPDPPFGPPLAAYESLLGKLSDSQVPRRSLIPNILDINHYKNSPFPVGPTFMVRISRDRVLEEVTGAGFKLHAEHDVLPYQYFLVFIKE